MTVGINYCKVAILALVRPMFPAWLVILTVLSYLGGLFAVALYGDTYGKRFVGERARSAIYVLSLGIYCTSWTFFGSVGVASSRGVEFLSIYVGPILVFILCNPLILRIVRIAKAQNVTSLADFVAARYGKVASVAALVAIIALIGVVPYIALQLKAISASLSTVLASIESKQALVARSSHQLSALVAVVLAGFAIAFGTRRLDATEHQDGLMLAIATESIVKLIAFLCVGAFVTWGMFGGLGDLAHRAGQNDRISSIIATPPDLLTGFITTLLSAFAIVLLPRQFHVTVVENRKEDDVRKAAWLFPLYLVGMNVFVIPLAIAGLIVFPHGIIDRDMTVLALPLQADAGPVVLLALIGGLSSATAMVIMGCVAVAIMVSNDLVMPLLLHMPMTQRRIAAGDIGRAILKIRRIAIVTILALSYVYFRNASESALAAIGLLSFACIAQIAPAIFGGFVWRRANSRGAIAGLIVGLLVWAYTLLLPSLDLPGLSVDSLIQNGPLGLAFLRPTALFGTSMPPLVQGTLFSLCANALVFVGFSFTRQPNPMERLQANVFMQSKSAPMAQSFRFWRSNVSIEVLEATVARYLGQERTQRSFANFLWSRGIDPLPSDDADIHLLRFAEHLIAAAIGAASSRLVVSQLLRRRTMGRDAALKLVDEVSAEIHYSRDLLQHAVDVARQGITVFDSDLRMVCWNREFRDLFELPSDLLRVGVGLDEIIRFNAERGLYGLGSPDEYVAARLEALVKGDSQLRLRLPPSGRVIEVRSARMPNGGIVATYLDATEQAESEEELEAANEKLEKRVRERTEELVLLNAELARAKAEAEEANVSKTRFLAAASHDLLQPLNAARLYATSLVERISEATAETVDLARNVDASLESVEEILTALLEISRLDAGALTPELTLFRIDEVLNQLAVEFGPIAREKGLTLTFVRCSAVVRSDRRLLRRLIQNLISNAIKYTPQGTILVGVRRRQGEKIRLEVWDTGIGIPPAKHGDIFREFERLGQAIKAARGAGLGLSIVERLGRVLDHTVSVRSTVGKGSVFTVEVPWMKAVNLPRRENAPALAVAQHKPLVGMVIAAIDNEPTILAGMAVLCEGWGCRFAGGKDRAQVLAELTMRELVPDVLIADYHLDERDGISVIVDLRGSFGGALPAILITAERSKDMHDRSAAHDIRVLGKPLRPAALRALLSQWRMKEIVAE
jgi:Na+/proline symporter/signal transduction histidine kinase/CheY-like chemotaxis protein